MPADPNQTTIIGPDTHIKGDMTFTSSARIMGTFEGRIAAKGELQVAETATCRAAVEASRVQVDGTIEGNVTAKERLELGSKARIKGDLVTSRLVVSEGASFVGHCSVGADAAKSAKSLDLDIPFVEPKAEPRAAAVASRVDGKAEPVGAGRR